MSIREYVNNIYEEIFEKGWVELWGEIVEWDDSEHILTFTDWRDASRVAGKLKDLVEGRKVIEVGAGVGLLAAELGKYADLVLAVELDPLWAYGYFRYVYPVVLREKRPVLYMVGDAFIMGEIGARFDVGIYAGKSKAGEFTRLLSGIAGTVVYLKPRVWIDDEGFHKDYTIEKVR